MKHFVHYCAVATYWCALRGAWTATTTWPPLDQPPFGGTSGSDCDSSHAALMSRKRQRKPSELST